MVAVKRVKFGPDDVCGQAGFHREVKLLQRISRAYFLRERKLTRHSVDHTPNVDGSRGARSHALTQSLGRTLTRRRIAPHVEKVSTRPGDTILFCTAGLTDLVEEHAIASLLGERRNHPALALTEAALNAAGRDNVTVATIRL